MWIYRNSIETWLLSTLIPIQNTSVIVHVCFVLFIVCLYTCVWEFLLQNNNHKSKLKIILIAGVPSSQALPGFLITAPPSVCVPDVIGVLVVWIQQQKKQKNFGVPFDSVRRFRATWLLRTTCMRVWCNGLAICLVAYQPKTKSFYAKGVDFGMMHEAACHNREKNRTTNYSDCHETSKPCVWPAGWSSWPTRKIARAWFLRWPATTGRCYNFFDFSGGTNVRRPVRASGMACATCSSNTSS